MGARPRGIRLEPSLSPQVLGSSVRAFEWQVVREASEIGPDLARIGPSSYVEAPAHPREEAALPVVAGMYARRDATADHAPCGSILGWLDATARAGRETFEPVATRRLRRAPQPPEKGRGRVSVGGGFGRGQARAEAAPANSQRYARSVASAPSRAGSPRTQADSRAIAEKYDGRAA
jgi:hypothetical protein